MLASIEEVEENRMVQVRYFVYEDYNDYKLHYCSDISILTKDNINPLFEGSEEECKEFIDVRSKTKNIRKVKKLTSSNGYEFVFNSETNMWECTKRPEPEVKTNYVVYNNSEQISKIEKDVEPFYKKWKLSRAKSTIEEELGQRFENIQKENKEKYMDTLSKKLSDIRSIVSLNSEAITSDAKIALIIEILK